MRLVDTHCHLDTSAFDADRDEALARAAAAGVERIVVPAIDPASWEPLLARCASTPALACGLGIHPQALAYLDPAGDGAALGRLGALLARGGARAVGECGLDGPTASAGPWGAMPRQLALLEAQLALAKDLALPVSLHVFRAHGDAVKLLDRVGPLPAGGVLHSYSGSAELVPRYAKLGWSFSFTGPVTYEASVRVHAAARAVPGARLLVETDAPDQPPSDRRGARNEPSFLPSVVRALARLRGEDEEELAATTTLNAVRLFGL